MTVFQRIKHNFFLCFSILACVFLLGFSSCKKDMTPFIGGDLQPENEYITAVFDDASASLRLIAYTIKDFPGLTCASTRSFFALGSFNAPNFGTISVDLISQIYEANTFDSVPATFWVDSIVLQLVYSRDFYPFDANNNPEPFYISIGELREPELIDAWTLSRTYRGDDFREQKNGGGTILSNRRIEPNFRDSIPDPNDTSDNPIMLHVPVLQIPLHVDKSGVPNPSGLEFANRLLSTSARNLPKSDLSQPSFLSEITGLYIQSHPAEPNTGRGNIVNFDFSNNIAIPSIIVYYKRYHKHEGVVTDSIVSATKIYTVGFWDAMTYNYINIDRETQSDSLSHQINKIDTTLGQSMVFLQSLFGSLIRVEMPDIREFAKKAGENQRIVINQASLVLSTSSNERFAPAASLNVGRQVSVDTTFNIRDHGITIGGGYNPNRGEYRIILTRHIQNLLLNPESENFPLTIRSNSRHFSPDITSIYGPSIDNGDRRMRLEIVYSILPNH